MTVENEADKQRFQSMLDDLHCWSRDWQMLFNMEKCHVLHTGRNNNKFTYEWGNGMLAVAEEEKDVGVIISDTLKPSFHCAKAARKANAVLGQMSRSISYRDRYTFLRLYKIYVKPHLQYCSSAWSPYTAADKDLLESVQRRSVGMITKFGR